jgi:hypothetical protein
MSELQPPKKQAAGMRMVFRTRSKSGQFTLTLKAVKDGYGLVESSVGLAAGDLLAMQPAGGNGVDGSLQLLARCEKEHERHKGHFVVRWEKLTSPRGTMSALVFLQSVLGVCTVAASLGTDPPEGEIVSYDFQAGAFNSPLRGALAPAQGDATSASLVRAYQPPTPLPSAAALRPQAPAAGAADESDMVDMYGIRMSRAAWEKMDNVGVVHAGADKRPRVTYAKQEIGSAPAGKPAAPAAKPEKPDEGKPEGGGLTGLLRKLAEKMTE